ncbi:MAG: extracellular solute-binding protein [Oscillospiraceae bacterium]|nr:extracellular solute-binding protein [Oscillospiraceae bacterium]
MKIRILSLLTAAAMTVSLSACAPKEAYVPSGATLEVSFDHSYKSAPLEPGLILSQPEFAFVGDDIFIKGYDHTEFHRSFALYDTADGSFHDICAYADGQTDSRYIDVIGMTEKDGQYTATYKISVPDGSDYANTYYQEVYDETLQVISEEDITARFPENMEMIYWTKIDDNYYGIALVDGITRLYCFDEDYQVKGEIRGGFSNPHSLFSDAFENVYILSYIGCASVCRLDPETLTTEPVEVNGMPEWPGEIVPGDGSCHFYLSDETGIFSVNTDTQTVEEIVNWKHSDFDSYAVSEFAVLPDGGFLAAESAHMNPNSMSYYKLTARPQEELSQMKLITMAGVGNGIGLRDLVILWNRQSTDSRIVLYDYAEENSDLEWNDNLEKFKNDLISGTVPDIIQLDSSSFALLANKGILEDLKPWMKQDEDFCEDDYLMHFFEALEYKNALPRMAFSFDVYAFMAKNEFIGDNTCLKPEDIPALAESLPEDMSLFGNTSREYAYEMLCRSNLPAFVDPDTGECTFDSKAFIDLLTYCGTLKAKGSNWGSYDEMIFRRDGALLQYDGLFCPYSYHGHKAGAFDNADVSLVGLASMDEKGNGGRFTGFATVGMCRESLYKEEIWEFFKFCLSEEVQDSLQNDMIIGMPVNRASLAKYAQKALEEPDPSNGNAFFDIGNEEIPLGPATQEEMDFFLGYIEGIRSMDLSNNHISDIMDEEAQMFFAGDQTAEQAAQNIQSRVSLYLSEQE